MLRENSINQRGRPPLLSPGELEEEERKEQAIKDIANARTAKLKKERIERAKLNGTYAPKPNSTRPKKPLSDEQKARYAATQREKQKEKRQASPKPKPRATMRAKAKEWLLALPVGETFRPLAFAQHAKMPDTTDADDCLQAFIGHLIVNTNPEAHNNLLYIRIDYPKAQLNKLPF